MSDSFSYILAELLKRNTELQGKELRRRGSKVKWPDEARKVIIGELSKYTFDSKMKAFSGLIWGRLRKQNITTRHIYGLLLQWALLLTEKNLLYFYTNDYEALIEELKYSIESGAEGLVDRLPSQEILDEWELMKGYLLELHKFVEKYEATFEDEHRRVTD